MSDDIEKKIAMLNIFWDQYGATISNFICTLEFFILIKHYLENTKNKEIWINFISQSIKMLDLKTPEVEFFKERYSLLVKWIKFVAYHCSTESNVKMTSKTKALAMIKEVRWSHQRLPIEEDLKSFDPEMKDFLTIWTALRKTLISEDPANDLSIDDVFRNQIFKSKFFQNYKFYIQKFPKFEFKDKFSAACKKEVQSKFQLNKSFIRIWWRVKINSLKLRKSSIESYQIMILILACRVYLSRQKIWNQF